MDICHRRSLRWKNYWIIFWKKTTKDCYFKRKKYAGSFNS